MESRYQIIVYAWGCGADEREEYRTLKEARAAARRYLKEWDSVSIFDLLKWRVAAVYGDFPVRDVYNGDIADKWEGIA